MTTMEVLVTIGTAAFALDCLTAVAERVMCKASDSDKLYTEAEIDEAYNAGFDDGKDEADQDAYEDGYAEGLADGRHDAGTDGYDEGYARGFDDGTNQIPVTLDESISIDLTQPEFDSPYSKVA